MKSSLRRWGMVFLNSILFTLGSVTFTVGQATIGTTVILNADPVTADGVTFELDGDAYVGTYGGGAYSFGTDYAKTATITIKPKIDISSIYFSWGTNVQGATLEFYDGATMITSIPWGDKGVLALPVNNVDKILFRENGSSRSGLGELQEITFTKAAPVTYTAPVLSTSQVNLPAIEEDLALTSNAGVKVSDLISGAASSSRTTNIGIAVVSRDGSNGSWQFLENEIWYNFERTAVPGESAALLLPSTTSVRFVPANNYHGSASFSFRAWDQSTGSAFGVADASVNGGTTAFSEATGQATISVSSVNDVPVFSGTVGKNVLQFNGANGYVAIPSLHINGDYTLEAWVYVNQHATWSRIADFGNGSGSDNILAAFSGGSNQLTMETYVGSSGQILSHPTAFPTGVWKHVATVNHGIGTGTLYIDGQPVSTGSQKTPIDIVRTLNYLGKSNFGQDAYFNGKMREVRVWDIARSQAQILENMDQALSDNQTGLVVYYPFSDGSGTSLTDASGNGRHATLHAGVSWEKDASVQTSVFTYEDTEKAILFRITDEDAGTGNISLSLASHNGVVLLKDDISGGLTTAQISGNNSTNVAIEAPLAAINKTIAEGGLVFTPDLNFSGQAKLTATINDNGLTGGGGSKSATLGFAITVTAVNDAPVITSKAIQNATEGQEYGYIFTATDQDGDGLTYSAPVVPSWLRFDPSTGILIGTPGYAEVGTHHVTLRVSDGKVDVDQSFTITVKEMKFPEIVGTLENKPAFFPLITVVDNHIQVTSESDISNPEVYISTGFQTGDLLEYPEILPTGITQSYDASTGWLSFTGTAPATEWQNILRKIIFRTTSPSTADRTISFVVADVVTLIVDGKPHFYQYISEDISWEDAKVAAEGKTFLGLSGYLATVTSQAENDFIKNRLSSDGWVGGSDYYQYINEALGSDIYPNQADSEGKWYWITGPEKGMLFSEGNDNPVAVNDSFINWNPIEPNDAGGEHYLQLYSSDDGKWNDLPADFPLSGYVVEFGGFSSDPALTIQHSRTLQYDSEAGITLSNSAIDEGMEGEVSVGTFGVKGADAGLNFYYQFVSGEGDTGNGIFSINGNELRVPVSFDYENTKSISIRVKVSDNLGGSYQQPLTITINNLNDNQPVISASQVFTLKENTEVGEVVGTVAVTDADGATIYSNWTVVKGNESGAFALDKTSGEIRVTNQAVLDYEKTKSFTLTLTVSDGIQTSMEEQVVINLINENDNAPVVATGLEFSLDENRLNESSVGTVTATDADGTTTFGSWTIISGNTADAFSIDPVTGEIKVAKTSALDYELIQSFTLKVSVSDGDNTSQPEEVVIRLNNLNDTKPVVVAGQGFNIEEQLAEGRLVGTVNATDADGQTAFSDWTIVSGNTEEAFVLNSQTGEITVANSAALNGSIQNFTLSITVSDGVNTSEAETVLINLAPINDAPVFVKGGNQEVQEDAGAQMVTGWTTSIHAGGPAEQDQVLAFVLTTDNAALFAVAPAISSNGTLTYTPAENAHGVANVSVKLTDNGGTANGGVDQSAAQTFTITVSPVNDAPVVTVAIADQKAIKEQAFQFTVPTGSFEDVDAGDVLTYSAKLSNGNALPAWLSFNAATQTFSGTPALADKGSLTIVVTATDNSNASVSDEFSLEVVDPNNKPTNILLSNVEIEENKPVGTIVGSFSTTDLDANDVHVYKLVEGEGSTDNSYFYIEGNKLFTNANFDSEIQAEYSIRIQSDDQNDGMLEKVFNIRVKDVVDARVYIPNLFSPNGDDHNDTFRVRANGIQQISFRIFNRMGEMVYETSDAQKATGSGWDGTYKGKELPSGSYVWQISGKFTDGTAVSFEGKNTGNITLIR